MANYSVKVINHLGSEVSFFLFQEPPQLSHVASKDIFTNIYQSALNTANDSEASFEIYDDVLAICGMTDVELGPNLDLSISSALSVNVAEGSRPGSEVSVMIAPGGTPVLDPLHIGQTTKSGTFAIRIGNIKVSDNKHLFVGVGKKDPTNNMKIKAISAFEAHPNTTYDIQPVEKYWFAYGSYQESATMFSMFSRNGLAIDFDDGGPPNRTILVDSSGMSTLMNGP